MLNTIGPYQFLELRGMPQLIEDRIEIVQRPGVDGTLFRRLGYHGDPFELLSRVDVANLYTGHEGVNHFKQMVGAGLFPIVYNSTPMILHNLLFVVLSVRTQSLRAITSAVGGLNFPSQAFLENNWTLMPVAVDTGD